MKIQPYLNFDGDCGDAFRHYAHVLGGDLDIRTNAESPGSDQIPESQGDRVMHARLVVGDQVLMASDAPPGQYQRPGGNYVSIAVEGAGEARRIFDALADGAQVQMPFDVTFWSPGFGMLVDRWGTPWMVNTVPSADQQADSATAESAAR